MGLFTWCFILPLLPLTVHSTGDVPDWALKRHLNYLPEYTHYAGKNASFLHTCSPLHCSGKGLCYVRDDIDENEGRFCECSSSHFGPKCEFENVCHNNPSFCSNYGSCKMVLDVTSSGVATGAHPECDCDYDTKGYRCEQANLCPDDSYCVHAESCFVLDSGESKCVCKTGVSGDRCDQYDTQSPCWNFDCGSGNCSLDSRDPSRAVCVCPFGLEGPRCNIHSDVCEQIPSICGPHGKCHSAENPDRKWRCECEAGWTGLVCEEVFTPCSSHECFNEGQCIVSGKYTQQCECRQGFTGDRCEQPVSSDCRSRPCENGGICSVDPEDGSALCACTEYWFGDFCELDVDECAAEGPELSCVNGATCRNMQEGYECLCMTGYSGFLCEIDDDDCSPNSCQNGAACEDIGPSQFFCHCPFSPHVDMPLYLGPLCSHPNPCINQTTGHSMCLHNGRCNIDGGYREGSLEGYSCDCLNTGYTGNNCEIDVNECEEETYLEAQNHFSASEPNRWFYHYLFLPVLDAFCLSNGSVSEIPQACDQHRALNKTTNLCVELGHTCINEVGKWRCECTSESAQSEGFFCVDYIDTCDPWNDPCKNGARCENKFNVTGLQKHSPDLHKCHCLPGFNGTFCELDLRCSNIQCGNATQCFDNPDTGFGECKCPPGEKACEHKLNQTRLSSLSCGDKDTGLICGERGSCVQMDHPPKGDHDVYSSTPSSYMCECDAGFTGETCEQNINDCGETPAELCKNGATCIDGVNEYFCSCVPGFEGSDCSIDINECLLNYTVPGSGGGSSVGEQVGPCLNGGVCLDGINGYACTCPVGFEGKHCENVTDMCRGAEWRDVVCPGNTTEKCLSQMHGSEVLVVCVCKPGYFGEKCQLLWNPCDGPQPASQGVTIVSAPHKSKKKDEGAVCVNEGVCHPVYLHGTKGSYTLDYMCDCLPGYTGKNCEIWSGECSASLCNNNGDCSLRSRSGAFSCTCHPGFTGDRCSVWEQHLTVTSSCKDYERVSHGKSRCQNGGQCVDTVTSQVTGESKSVCKCKHGFVGELCEVPPEPSVCRWKNPCKYGQCINHGDSFRCECLEGFSGEFCDQIDLDQMCDSPCLAGIEQCVQMPKPFKPRCLFNNSVQDFEVPSHSWYPLCNPDWCGLGMFHNYPGVEVACMANVGTTKCICPRGRIGEYDCSVVINLCTDEDALEKCDPEGTLDCVTLDPGLGEPAQMECRCKPGFRGRLCEVTNDVCSRDTNPCQNGGECVALSGDGFKCDCPAGFGCENCSCSLLDLSTPQPCDSSFCNSQGTCYLHRNDVIGNNTTGGVIRKCNCVDGVIGDTCFVDSRNECDFDPCSSKKLQTELPPTYQYKCVDRSGFYECVVEPSSEGSSPSSAGSTLTPATKSPYSQNGTTLIQSIFNFKILVTLGSVLCVILFLLLVLKGATGTKVVVHKTYYPTGWLEAIRSYKHSLVNNGSSGGSSNDRKRKRDEPAGQYEMGSTTEGDYYSSEYSEIENGSGANGNSSKRFRPKLDVSPPLPLGKPGTVDGGSLLGGMLGGGAARGLIFTSPPLSEVGAPKRMACGVDNTTPAMLILQNKNPEVRKQTLKEMVEAGYDMNTQNLSRHETVLHQAILHCDVECVRVLLQSPTIDLSISDVNNRNAVMTAAATANENIFELVCCHSTRDMLNQQQDDGSTALMAASKFLHSTSILRRLIEIGVDVNTQDNRGRTALHWAAQVGNHEGVVLLLQAKADKDVQDCEECTPLMHAVRDGCDECVLKLLELGADRSIENRDRQTALDIARDYQNTRIIHYLENVLSIMAPMEANSKKSNRKTSKAKQKKEPKRRAEPPTFAISPLGTPLAVQNTFSPRLPPHMISPPTAVFSPVSGHVAFTQASNVQLNPAAASAKIHFNPNANVHFNTAAPSLNFLSPLERGGSSSSSLKREKFDKNGGFLLTPAPITMQGNMSHSHHNPQMTSYSCLNRGADASVPPLTNVNPQMLSYPGQNPTNLIPSSVTTAAPNVNVAKLNIHTAPCARNDITLPNEIQKSPSLSSIHVPQQKQDMFVSNFATSKQFEFVEDWSSTIPAIQGAVKLEDASSLDPADMCFKTDQQTKEFGPPQQNSIPVYGGHAYEKVNYDYACLPKVTSTVLTTADTPDNNNFIASNMPSRALPATPTSLSSQNGSAQSFNENASFNNNNNNGSNSNNSSNVSQKSQQGPQVASSIPVVSTASHPHKVMGAPANNGYLDMTASGGPAPNSNYFSGPPETNKVASASSSMINPVAPPPNNGAVYQNPQSVTTRGGDYDFDNPIYQAGSVTSSSVAPSYFQQSSAPLTLNGGAMNQQHGGNTLNTASAGGSQAIGYSAPTMTTYNNPLASHGRQLPSHHLQAAAFHQPYPTMLNYTSAAFYPDSRGVLDYNHAPSINPMFNGATPHMGMSHHHHSHHPSSVEYMYNTGTAVAHF